MKTPSYEFSDKFDQEVTTGYTLSIVSRADYSETIVQDKLNCEIEQAVSQIVVDYVKFIWFD